MIAEQYVWLVWSSAFLIPWGIVYWLFSVHRRAMLWASLFTMPFGLTEPLFVPEYWMPPSLFDLAKNTGFDIESLIFCFAIGGVSSVFYNLLTHKIPQLVEADERRNPSHRHHYIALVTPPVVFIVFYLFPWNPIYPSIFAMFFGAVATILCRPDLKRKTWVGGLLFLGYYAIFLAGLEWSNPGYIDRIWNMDVLTGVKISFMPIEELVFAIGFGMYWSGVYEHINWRKLDVADDPMVVK
tara:strand:- start:29533 stop:30252 length:720 start_codon:yes stop_codon:yes gene_type:complete